MSATTLTSQGLRINNPHGQIERISIKQNDFSLSNSSMDTFQRIINELESAIVATTISTNNEQQIENIIYSKEPLIRERNSILSNPFKFYNPFFRKKLNKIDATLDELDLQLYYIESKMEQVETELDNAIELAKIKAKNLREHS